MFIGAYTHRQTCKHTHTQTYTQYNVAGIRFYLYWAKLVEQMMIMMMMMMPLRRFFAFFIIYFSLSPPTAALLILSWSKWGENELWNYSWRKKKKEKRGKGWKKHNFQLDVHFSRCSLFQFPSTTEKMCTAWKHATFLIIYYFLGKITIITAWHTDLHKILNTKWRY